MSELREFLEAAVAPILVALLLLAIVIAMMAFVSKAACYKKAEALELKAEWGMLQGCIVERPDGVKVDIENYGRAEVR